MLPPRQLRKSELLHALDPHQKEGVEFAVRRLSAGLFFEQGTGKTWITLGVLDQIIPDHENFEGYIVGPLSNLETTWHKQIRRQLPQINFTSDWEEYKKLPFPRMLIIHYEYFVKVAQYMKRRSWHFGCFDESQRLKDRGSLSSRRAKQLSEPTYRKLILSGTPDDGHEYDYWGQLRYFAPFVFGDNWEDFFIEYLKPTGYMGYKFKFREAKLKQFNSLIAPWCMYQSVDVLGRPPPQVTRVWCTMKGDQRRYYDELESTMVIDDLDLMTDFEMVKITKLAQICGGHLLDEDYVYEVGTVKQRRCEQIVEKERSDLPIVIFCRYTEEVNDLRKRFKRQGLRVATIEGRNKKTRNKVQRKFQAGLIDILIAQIRTGGVGIDLYRSHVAIVYSSTYSRIDFDQAIARLHRRGQKYEGPVRVYILICRDSVDEEILTAIIEKRSVSKRVLSYLKRRRRQMTAKKKPSPKKKAAAKKKVAASKAKAPAEAPKYGVADLAKALGIKPASARVRLRNANVAKAGKSYGWNSQKDLDAVVKQLKSDDKEAA